MRGRHVLSGAIIVAAALIAGASALPFVLLRPEPIEARHVPQELVAPPPQRAPLAEPFAPEPVNIAAPAPAEPVADPPPRAITFPAVQPVGIEQAREPSAPAPAAASPPSARPAAEKQANAGAERARRKAGRGVRPAVYPIREFLAWQR